MEHEQQLREVENQWKSRLSDVTTNLEAVKEQLEKDAQQKMENLVEQHRLELGNNWCKTHLLLLFTFTLQILSGKI